MFFVLLFCLAFLSRVVFHGYGISNRWSLDAGAREVLSSQRTLWTRFTDAADTDSPLLPGPYVFEKGLLWKVSRLYEDTANAFTLGLRTVSSEGYYKHRPDILSIEAPTKSNLSVISQHIQGSGRKSAITVPSRLCVREPRSLPLHSVESR